MNRHPIKTLKQKARDCGGCAKRREAVKAAWNRVLPKRK